MAGSWKSAARAAFIGGGGLRAVRWISRNGLRILMYHRFNNAAALERQCRHLRESYQLVSLSEAADSLERQRPLPSHSVVVTVDDGYRDFYEIAYPIFSVYRIPVTVYLVTDFLDGNLWLWTDQIEHAFLKTNKPELRMALPGDTRLELSLGSEEERQFASQRTMEALKLLSNEERLGTLAVLPQVLDVEIPVRPPRGYEALTWDQLKEMAHAGVEFGAHTRTHPVLSRLSLRSQLADEISGSKRRLEEALQMGVRHFCYPNGLWRDISAEAVETVRLAGYQTAVTAEPGLNSQVDDLLRLRSVAVDPTYEPLYFQQCAAAFLV